MTNNEKQIMLKSVITGFCIAERSFTSSEVANHMKRLGVWIRNRHVAEYLRENVVNIAEEYGIDYIISAISVDAKKNNPVYTNCYHLSTFNTGNYLSRDIVAITPDEFEAMHGISPFKNNDIDKQRPTMEPTVGGISFMFPDSK